jgi:HEAT repeat protein
MTIEPKLRKETNMASVDSLIERLKSDNPDVRTEAWLSAGEVGAPALKPLAQLAARAEQEVRRASQRAMWKIVRHVGDPAAPEKQKTEVVQGLLELLAEGEPDSIRREVLWMLSEIAGDESVEPIASFLKNTELREDARMVLDRIPGDKSVSALKTALAQTNDDFKHNIAQSLRRRGVDVPGMPERKLVPTRETGVAPVKT